MRVFFSYSHMDEAIRDQLEVHCAVLKRNGEIETWYDRRILGGDDFNSEIRFELEHADIILMIVSQHFLNSDYCYSVEMTRAIQRAEEGTAQILPVIAEVCDWKSSPLRSRKALPNDGKPLSKLANINDGFLEIVREIRRIIKARGGETSPAKALREVGTVQSPQVRSSNLRIKKQFSAADRDRFLFDTFEYLAKFFESSLEELANRNKDIEVRFRSISANHFTCQIYRNGADATECQVRLKNTLGRSHQITYSYQMIGNGFNESLSVEDDEQTLYLKPMMQGVMRGEGADQLTQEGAAELLWSMLIDRLQS